MIILLESDVLVEHNSYHQLLSEYEFRLLSRHTEHNLFSRIVDGGECLIIIMIIVVVVE